jgi:hypothetical protein
LEILKEKMVTKPILVFLDWSKEFHVHVDASSIALEEVLTQPGEGDIDHPIAFASRCKVAREVVGGGRGPIVIIVEVIQCKVD